MKKIDWLSQELSRLNPVDHARRYAQLSFETRYGHPMFLHALFSVAFAYNMADPRIAAVLYRGGQGKIMKATRQRNFETLVFIGKVYEQGSEGELAAVLAEIKKRHSPFNISNELYLYTLSTFACLPARIAQRVSGLIDENALKAQFYLWKDLGEKLGIQDVPSSLQDFLQWMVDYEIKHFVPSPDAQNVTKALAHEWASYWFPQWVQPLARQFFYALIEPDVQRYLGVSNRYTMRMYTISTVLLRIYLSILNVLPPPQTERSLVKTFSQKLDVLFLQKS